MDLTFKNVPGLPKLAWLAVVDRAAATTRVVHGPAVETRDRFFIEGAWDGGFASGDFSTTECVFGSGGGVTEDSVWFASSAATTDYLYWHQADARVVVANSLPLLLAHLDDRLDPQFDGYDRINLSIIYGIDGYIRDIPTERGGVHRLMFRNLRISADGPQEYDKEMPPRFPTYEVYYDYVVSRYGRIAANARDPERRQPMAILSTQSRGYDTTALNAVAARFGVDTAFTVTHGKPGGEFVDRESAVAVNDDGSEICAVLGIPCVPIDRRAFERDFKDEYLYYAALDSNQDANLKEITDHTTRSALLLTGTLGELWYTRESYDAYIRRYDLLDDKLKRVDLGGHGLTEVRLSAGFVQLAFPYIGARQRRDIFEITESPAMDPWRLRNSYDRPIPRRMAEEAGVPREMFGQVKMATVVQFVPPPVPVGADLRSEYFAFLTKNRLLASWQLALFPRVHRLNSRLWFAGEQRHPWIYYTQRAISKIIRRDYRFPLWWRRLIGSVFCFCANRRADEYSLILGDASPASAAHPSGTVTASDHSRAGSSAAQRRKTISDSGD